MLSAEDAGLVVVLEVWLEVSPEVALEASLEISLEASLEGSLETSLDSCEEGFSLLSGGRLLSAEEDETDESGRDEVWDDSPPLHPAALTRSIDAIKKSESSFFIYRLAFDVVIGWGAAAG